MSRVIVPRREDALLNNEVASLRYIRYFEEIADASNISVEQVEINTANIASNVTDIGTNTLAIAANITNINTNTVNIAANATDIASNVTDIATNSAAIASIDLGSLSVQTTNYTTTGAERVLCNAAITISLDATPADDTRVYIKRINGSVTVSGNGNLIDGETSIILSREYTTLLFVYSSTLSNWYIM